MASKANKKPKNKLSKEKYARLKAEAEAPYRGLRKFIYIAFAASGFIGAMVFVAQLAARTGDPAEILPNLAIQIGVIALMVFLFQWEQKAEKKN